MLFDPIDGLPLIADDVQDRLQQISIEHKVYRLIFSYFKCDSQRYGRSQGSKEVCSRCGQVSPHLWKF